jgi:hypothetical protein
MRFSFSGSSNITAVMGVHIMPGATAFTRMPNGASSIAIVYVMPQTLNLDAA